MAHQIEIWDPESSEYRDSHREYDHYLVTAIQKSDDSWDRTDGGVTLNLYVDEQTGVVVKDVAKYEASLRKS